MHPRALVIGGTGPTGPAIVAGLVQRNYQVTILHSGLHEVDLTDRVEHLHADPHTEQSLREALEGRGFELVIAMYGRLRHVAAALVGKTQRLIAIGGVFYDGWINDQFHDRHGEIREVPQPAYAAPRVPVDESSPMDANEHNSFARRALESEELVRQLHHQGIIQTTMLRFPKIYGPRAIAPIEWCIVRRALDGRRRLIVPDGGLALETKLYSGTASAAVLAVVDNPAQTAGRTFNVGDDRALMLREWISMLVGPLGRELELVSMPFDCAHPSYAYARDPWTISHRVLDVSSLKKAAKWQPVCSPEVALASTAEFLAMHRPELGGLEESQIGDPFNYDLEDRYLSEADAQRIRVASLPQTSFRYRHPYRHPAPEVPS